MKKQNESSSSQIQREGKVKLGFVISNTPQNNLNTVVKKKEKSMSPQSQNLNTLNQVGQIESQQTVQAKVQKTEKQYISKLETQLKVQNKKKNDLVDSNHNLEYLLKLQDQKLQTYIEEIKQLRNYNEQLFKENKQLHLKVEGFAQERNNLLADNKLLKETVKKLEIRLSLIVRPTQRKNILKTISDFSRENQYVDATLLQNEQTIQQYASNYQSNKENDNLYQSRSNSPRLQENNFFEGNINNLQRESLSNLHQRNLSNNSLNQQKTKTNTFTCSQTGNNYNQNNASIQGGSSSSNSRTQLNIFPQSQQYVSQMNSNRSSQQFSQVQQNSAHFNNQTNNSNSLLQTANLKTEQTNQEQYLKKLQEQIKVLEDERETYQYEIKLLNQALTKDSSNEQMQKLIKDLVESKQRISQFTKNQTFLEEKITQFEKLIDQYTHHNPFEMDRASLERKNIFLIQENQNYAETIQKLEEEIKLLKSSNNRSLQIQQLEADKLSGSNYNYLTTNSSGRDIRRQMKENQSPLSNRSLSGSLSQSPHHSSGTLQAGSKSEKLTLAASIKNQKINSKGKNALQNCCKDVKRLGSKTKTSDKYNINYKSSNNGANYDLDETRRLLQVEKQKNQLLSKMLEEEQEKTSEYLVYKEEIDFYHQKNKQLQNDILLLQSQLNQIQLSNLSIKVPMQQTQIQEANSPRQVSMSPRQQIKRICNTQQPIQGNIKRPQSPNQSQGNLNYEPRSPSQSCKSARRNTQQTDGYSSDEEGVRKCRVPGIAAGMSKGKNNYNKRGGGNEEQSDQILAFMQIEKELNQELQKKEKQIENIINSRNLMQKTLGDQIIIIKNQNKQLNEQTRDLENQIIILNEEVKSLRVLVKRAEKKNLIGNDFIPNND
ncbi:hypothetical protein TTHERM_01205240 (macronuclear) [Tetrahymena thermophila SB210]|uniref:Uncharacterized protein n=1 Tax=Tetrahymena thermophila (strain SB210) TaxID=312017 RepID=Q22AI6_TETTS|nr:hypothetical protein TTHERM_01205240 [Tetrahymena thermophila SB210]EAR82288.1 hypothetical protein TTHERM_01205240 [Tetrahymena thermophila SB210]|eukprot:XP_001029951.1 hypothetical protein TTHERM_01205240 [Tetrahymena thermophila SB210]